MSNVLVAFLTYAVLALAVESAFTGVADQVRRKSAGLPVDPMLPCRTSLWSIAVYGLSAAVSFPLLHRLYPAFFAWPWWLRGAVYIVGTYACEFSWGWVLERLLGTCPWQYKHSSWKIWRYIKPRYAGYWFAFGFVQEWTYLRLVPLITHSFRLGF